MRTKMQEQLKFLYRQIKEGKISHEDAGKRIKELKARYNERTGTPPAPGNKPHAVSDSTAKSNTGSLRDNVQTVLLQTVSQLLKVKIKDIDMDSQLKEYGFDPVTLTELVDKMNRQYGLELTPAIFAEYPTLRGFAGYLVDEHSEAVVGPDGNAGPEAMKAPSKNTIPPVNPELLHKKTVQELKVLLGETIKMEAVKIDAEAYLGDYGIDSVMITQLNQKLTGIFGELSKTLFYEYQTLEALAGYFITAYPHECGQWTGLGEPSQAVLEAPSTRLHLDGEFPLLTSLKSRKKQKPGFTPVTPGDSAREPIAIIGMSGRFPGAKTLAEYWENLQAGKNCIREIPRDRWHWEKYYQDYRETSSVLGKSCSKWGGFLDDFDRFDPLFFNMTPREAENIDPQERLFLEECWKALEDAGYAPSKLSPGLRQRTGVFGGITKQGFNLYGGEKSQGFPATSFSSLVNRVSYFLNLQGPSIPIDTMCSSALAAIHEACEYLRYGRGDMAIAGGVNLYLHPSTYVGLSMAQVISHTPHCAAFAKGGTGFVPGEGVGAVILKPYYQALADGDSIYALIQGTAVNHDGRTNSYTTPNPHQQAAVIRQALAQNNLDPRAISYIEAAAHGSEMGDAIEMTALTKVFGNRHEIQGDYKIGSVKPNIGHCEAASGMSQLIKTILQLNHKTLAPTLLTGDLNPNINFDQLPFRLQLDLSPWKPLTVGGHQVPRRAGITGIGAGGVNAHIIVEEYSPAPQTIRPSMNSAKPGEPLLFILSAKNEERLADYAAQWIAYLKKNQWVDLANAAYTLQTGREEMPCRLAMVVHHPEELTQQLQQWNKHRENKNGCYFGDLNNKKVIHEEIAPVAKTRDLHQLAKLWVLGNSIPWDELYPGKKPARTPGLPTYPFKRRRCWINNTQSPEPKQTANKISPPLDQDDKNTNKAVELYTLGAQGKTNRFEEEYLTFCPFAERVPGFSMSGVLLYPEKHPAHYKLMKAKQIEMRQVLFCKENFEQIHTLLDIGCGYGTDVIQIAELYPHIQAHGYTITRSQAELGQQRLEQKNLSAQVNIFHKDSSKDSFSGGYDLVIGIEVSFHIRNKQGLFHNIASSLNPGGRVLLVDYIANLRGPIVDPKVEISIPTQQDWIDLLSRHQLVIEEIIDVSPQIANFLYDPQLEQNIENLPQVARDTLRNYANQSISLEKGWISYCLFKLKSDSDGSEVERREYNAERISRKTPYPEALTEMHRRGHIPYPKSRNSMAAEEESRGTPDLLTIKEGLLEVFNTVLGLQREELEEFSTFKELGIGSLNAVELLEAINRKFDLTLPTSIVFECNDLNSLAAYIGEQQPTSQTAPFIPAPANPIALPGNEDPGAVEEITLQEKKNQNVGLKKHHEKTPEDIAIIGLSCRCAGANGPDEFWDLVSRGNDCIREIKNKSWLDFFKFNAADNIPARYGAMSDIEYFDPLFFNISPLETEMMDVSQRILLEESYKALEDSGYTPSFLRKQPVGTFIGAMASTPLVNDLSHFSMLGSDTSILASRIAYFLDLKGPALAINTACSSSLVAIDIACQQLKNHDIDLAIAGGITIYTHPAGFIAMNNAGMLSPTGECRPFDHRANGIVVGDGVGIVILKRLAEAERDNDHIYGIIRGSGTNQDGQTSGITVPSFLSQSQLEESVYRKNHICVEDLQYLEAHGTATKLGDPVEVHALQHAFATFTAKKQFCAIGSVKANIGHTTAAAGVLSVIKVLLSLEHKQIPPAVHFNKGNEHIDFANSPFFVNTTLKEWPVNSRGGRLAAVSSFGFSGTNAHLVIEGYGSGEPVPPQKSVSTRAPAIVVLSAKTEASLRDQVQRLLAAAANPERQVTDTHLADIAYTLQVGREPMEERLAVIVGSIKELQEKLEGFLEGKNGRENIYRGQIKRSKETLAVFTADEELQEAMDKWVQRKKYGKLLNLWVKGLIFDWNKLYGPNPTHRPRRISLPTYAFARERYPLPGIEAGLGVTPTKTTAAASPAFLHPLVQENTSDLWEQRFSSTFTGQEFFLTDHVVKGQRVLPGVVYIEMARAALELAAARPSRGEKARSGIRLKNVVWTQPLILGDQPVRVHIGLFPGNNDNAEIDYEIYSEPETDDTSPMVHSQGTAVLSPVTAAARAVQVPTLDINALQTQCSRTNFSPNQYYETFREIGIDYGPGHQGLEEVYVGENQVLAKLALPASVSADADQFVLHPSLLDSALQASVGLMMGTGDSLLSDSSTPLKPALPFALQELEVHGDCTPEMWALARYSDGSAKGDKVQKLDIDMCDHQGRICVRMKGFSTRVLEGEREIPGGLKGTIMLTPVWDAIPAAREQTFPAPTDQVVIVGGSSSHQGAIQHDYPQACVLEISSHDSIEAIAQKLETHGPIDHIFWIAPYQALESTADEALITGQNQGVLQCFRMVKALLGLGYETRDLGWSVITIQTLPIRKQEKVNPTHAGFHGFVGSMAREYLHWKVRLIDLAADGDWPGADIFTLPPDPRGDTWAYRGRQWYRQQLIPFHCPPSPGHRELYRPGGVYVVIGGAGGLGEAWSEYMIRTYRAHIIWIGRRPADTAIRDQLARLANPGPAPLYIAADASQREALHRAYEEIKQLYTQIHGVVHSAIDLRDQSLAKMEEEKFRTGLSAKVEVSVRLTQVFQKEPLDFILFFSSMATFIKAPGQSNYAAGCAFKDAFAYQLSHELPAAVKVMNWGYWGSIGTVSAKAYQERMSRVGIGSIEPPEAMKALETLMAGPMTQIGLIKTLKPLVMEGTNPGELISVYPQTLPVTGQNLQEQIPKHDSRVRQMKSEAGPLIEEMNRLLGKLLWNQLRSLGLFTGKKAVISDLEAKIGLPDLYRRWFAETTAVLTRNHYLRCDGEVYTVLDTTPPDMEAVWKEWDQRKEPWLENPNTRAQVVLVETTMRALPQILTGQQSATEILFPGSSVHLVEGIYKNNQVADYFNEVLADTVAAYLQERLRHDSSAAIRILEIGAGTGGTSTMVFKKIQPYQEQIQEYCYTDISKAFLLHAQKEYGPLYPYLTYRIFNVEAPLAGQDIAVGGYDMVIAANVLHATKNIRQTLRNAKAALKKHGLLLLHELSSNSLFTHLTFGLLAGWWLYEDPGLRIPGCPGLLPETWQEVLKDEGFQQVFFPAREVHDLGQQVVAAQSDGIVRQPQPLKPIPKPMTKNLKKGLLKKISPTQHTPPAPAGEITPELLREKATAYIKNLVAETLKIPDHKIDPAEPLEKYGIDSILVVQLTNALRGVFANISSTLFFEYQTIDALVEHFLKTQKDSLMALVGLKDREPRPTIGNDSDMPGRLIPMPSQLKSRTTPRFHSFQGQQTRESTPPPTGVRDIAIIGLAGRYPQADNINEFWQHLKEGRNCITEIPPNRWDWQEYFDEKKGKWGSMYTKWGGFIRDIDKFDPLFFQISPQEAEKMDPQERLFLEVAYASIEDAGYTPANLCQSRKVGVFVGVMNANYPTGASYWSIANRISYLLNFQGPSLAVDTACSSSLTAIHSALDSLYNGLSECALVGGVNLIVDPVHYLKLTAVTMLSSGNQNKTFGDQADGFVDGEGVGAIVLKPLPRAIRDGDHIYGIIKGSALNAGGKTNGYTVPNPQAQSRLIAEALQRSGIDARTISYLEAHGTATALGDPIEITGLTGAFAQTTQDKQFCAIGSVKSNIGHCEGAAGIAGVTKILLQLRYGQLVPSLHANVLNPHIDFSSTPFVVQQELAEWKRPLVEINGKSKEYPRRAGISSFGAGGANAHLLIEEYIPWDPEPPPIEFTTQDPAIIVLSAKNEKRLQEQVRQLLTAVTDPGSPFPDTHLANMAYTLQVGREAMEERLAIIVRSIKELEEKLNRFLEGHESIPDLYRGQVKRNKDTLAVFAADEDMANAIDAWISKGKYTKLLNLWVKGLIFDWNKLYADGKFQLPRRISLPTYPFARERYWVSKFDTRAASSSKAADSTLAAALHPLLQQNTSDFSAQRFSSTFTGQEFFLADHVVKGRRILPGVAYLEMARAAVDQALGTLEPGQMIRLKNIVWARPIIVETSPVQVHIELFPGSNDPGEIAFEIYSKAKDGGAEPLMHSQGSIVPGSVSRVSNLDINALQADCRQASFSASQCYEAFAAVGIHYGPTHQGIEQAYIGTGQVLAKLALPAPAADTQDRFVLHPSLMDSALQASVGLMLDPAEPRLSGQGTRLKPSLAFALHELEILAPCTSSMWALIRASDNSKPTDRIRKLDIDLCDDQGSICVRMKKFSFKVLDEDIKTENDSKASPAEPPAEPLVGTGILAPVWDSIPLEKGQTFPAPTDQVLIVGGTGDNRNAIQKHYPQARVLEIQPGDTRETIANKLEAQGVIDHILWIAPDYPLETLVAESLIEMQHQGVFQVFAMIKALLNLGYGTRVLGWSIVTIQAQPVRESEAVNPTHAGIHGLIGSMTREYDRWKVRLIDLEADCDWPIADIFTLPSDPAGNAWVYRGREWYRQKLVLLQDLPAEQTLYRPGGVYVVIGGAGAIGEVWSEYMIRTYQAQITWIGRREKDAAIRDKLDRLAALGPAPRYIAADAADATALHRAYEEIKQHNEQIHGVIHSAVSGLGRSLDNTQLEQFQADLRAKLDVSVRIAQVFQAEPLDFVLFFSSINSYLKARGQSSYASGCTFNDAFAHQLAQQWPCPVKVMNWGYWGSVGVIHTSETFQNWMTQAGIGSIEPPEAMEALETLLAAPMNQMALVKTTKPSGLKGMNVAREFMKIYPGNLPENILEILNKQHHTPFTPGLGQASVSSDLNTGTGNNNLLNKVQAALIQTVSQSLRVKGKEIDVDVQFNEYGFEPITLTEFANQLNQEYELELTPSLFIEYPTLHGVAQYLVKEYRDVFAKRFPPGKPAAAGSGFNTSAGASKERLQSQRLTMELSQQMEEMDQLLCKLLWGQLQSMGLFKEKNSVITDLKTKSDLRDLYDGWFKETMAVLARNRYLQYDGKSCTVIDTTPIAVETLWKEWGKKKGVWLENPNMKPQVVLVEATLRALPQILTGKKPATDIMFPNSSMELVEGIYKNNIVADYFNEVLAGIVAAYIQERLHRDSTTSVKILEIGAGTGGTSHMVFKKLQPYQEQIQEYCYTDISRAFLMHAEKEYGPHYPYLTYKTFNVEKPIARQGINAGKYDIVIAANVLHATKNIRQSLRNAKAALEKNGLILLNELNGSALFLHLTFGLLEGWWLYEDPELRIPGCPGLSSKTWQKVLEREGFQPVFFPVQETHDWGQQIIAAQSNGVVRQKLQAQPGVTPAGKRVKTTAGQSHLQEAKPVPARPDVTDQMLEDHVREIITGKLAESLKLDIDMIDVDDSFADYGLDSILGVNLVQTINQELMIELETTILFDYSSVNQLTTYIVSQYKDVISAGLGQEGTRGLARLPNLPEDVKHDLSPSSTEKTPVSSFPKRFSGTRLPGPGTKKSEENTGGTEIIGSSIQKEPIAIIGMSGRFAKSKTVKDLWEHLANGTDLVEEVSRWNLSHYFSNENKNYCHHGSFLEDIDQFDALFFNISGVEATYTDPQQRFFLEECWKALEDAGYAGTAVQGRLCGVYVGCSAGDYQYLFEDQPPAYAMWGNITSVIPARIAYFLNLQGPAAAIDTACSSSLVAIHFACQGLWARETELALAGGVFIQATPRFYISGNKTGMFSPNGRCHTFDQRADGFVPGEGVGVVVLKQLKEAITDGDHIYGVIRGSGINQDGTTNGITAPSTNSQERLERWVYDTYHIDPGQVRMVEAHGTGTILGDPIEFEALSRAFKHYTDKKEYCAIGSIKTNIGHATSAAGIAGFIKVLLALQHKQIPPSLHYQSANPNINFKDSPFYVNTTLQDWKVEANAKRLALISSFGLSGTNAHLAIEEAPALERQLPEKPGYLIVLSARTKEQLHRQAEQLVEYCQQEPHPDIHCGDLSFTLLLGRKHFNHRLACVVHTREELVKLLNKWLGKSKVPQIYVSHLHEKNHREQPSLKRYGNQCIQHCQNTNHAGDYLEHLSAIADLYTQGYRLEFEQLFLKQQYSRVSLPTYPFDRERYWVTERDTRAAGSPAAISIVTGSPAADRPIQRTTCFLKKQWEPCPASAARNVKRTIAILTTGETAELATLLAQHFPSNQILHLHELESQSRQPEEQWKNYDGCVDLVGCGTEKNTSLDWMAWLGQLIEHGHREGLMMLCVTRGLESYQNNKVNLAGASRAGLYRMLQSEYSHLRSRHMDVNPGGEDNQLARLIASEFLTDSQDPEVCYREGKRFRAYLREIPAGDDEPRIPVFPEEQVLWVTGGTRGLGYLCARHFVTRYGVKRLVLTGREPMPPRDQWDSYQHQDTPTAKKIRNINALETLGAEVRVLSMPLTDELAVQQGLQEINHSMGPIGGVIHCAGIIDYENPAFIRKPVNKMQQVLTPKVDGLDMMIQCFKNEPLQVFILFSSVSAVIPGLAPGQSDYAMANAYMDYAAEANFPLFLTGSNCHMVSIQWPNWKETGMGEAKSRVYGQSGLLSLSDAEGLQLLDRVLSEKMGPVVLPAIVNPDIWKPRQLMQRTIQGPPPKSIQSPRSPAGQPAKAPEALVKATQTWLLQLFSKELQINASKLDIDTSFQDYGVDSILLAQLLQKINQQLAVPGDIDPSILFEYSTIDSLAVWLASNHASALSETLGISISQPSRPPTQNSSLSLPSTSSLTLTSMPKTQELTGHSHHHKTASSSGIAVIGLSCRFPGSSTLAEYWQLLSEGRSAIGPVPRERWGYSNQFHAGLLDNITHFDPKFFLIPREDARAMDPQALLVLEESLNLFYHAGYSHLEIKGKPVGVFLGGRSQHQPDVPGFLNARNPIVLVGQNYLAANISQFFDLHGPAVVLDTACSSALVGMNMAIQALHGSEIDSALVGGVSLLTTEGALQVFQQRNLLSPGPTFHVFDQRASGVVLGEGVGMVLLKTVEQALADGDHIYAVIRALAINNDGRTPGPAAPNLKAQKEVMQTALGKSGKKPEEINYIEANGSGSEVTDLLELKAIQSIYRSSNSAPCALGSIKPNIGHPQCAEGIAGFIKVVLMLHHRQWVPFLSGQQPMKHYDLESSPFYFCRKLTEWTTIPRIAAINSFADGGTNAHVILEAWGEPPSRPIKRQPLPPPQLHRYDVRHAEAVTSSIPQENRGNKKAQKKPNKEEHTPLLKQLQPTSHRVISTWKENIASNQVTSTWKKNKVEV